MSTQLGKTVAEPVKPEEQLDYHALNAMLNLYDANGKIQFEKDREAANQFFLQHVNQNTVYFHDLEEKIDYLINNKYYDPQVIEQYDFSFIKELFKRAYSYKFRFKSFLGAYKYYTSYTLKTFDGKRYLERFEDRVAMTALFLASGNEETASALLGATLLVLADLASRTIAMPAEVPIGMVTALLGAPFFLYLLRQGRKGAGL